MRFLLLKRDQNYIELNRVLFSYVEDRFEFRKGGQAEFRNGPKKQAAKPFTGSSSPFVNGNSGQLLKQRMQARSDNEPTTIKAENDKMTQTEKA